MSLAASLEQHPIVKLRHICFAVVRLPLIELCQIPIYSECLLNEHKKEAEVRSAIVSRTLRTLFIQLNSFYHAFSSPFVSVSRARIEHDV